MLLRVVSAVGESCGVPQEEHLIEGGLLGGEVEEEAELGDVVCEVSRWYLIKVFGTVVGVNELVEHRVVHAVVLGSVAHGQYVDETVVVGESAGDIGVEPLLRFLHVRRTVQLTSR